MRRPDRHGANRYNRGMSEFPEPPTRADSTPARSLRAIAELPVELVLVSHGEPVLEDAKARMAEALARR